MDLLYRTTQPQHTDVENGVSLGEIYYEIYGNPEECKGLLFYIFPMGGHTNQTYTRNALMPYLHEKTGYCCVCADYFGINLKVPTKTKKFRRIPPLKELIHFFQQHQLPMPSDFDDIFRILSAHDIKKLPRHLMFLLETDPDYQSFGLLSALDYVSVFADLHKSFNIKHKQVTLYGSSFGGYIAMLMAKLMPNSISYIIENSGFHETNKAELNFLQANAGHTLKRDGVEYHIAPPPVWDTLDPQHPHFFDENNAAIRDLKIAEHFIDSDIPLFSFHGEDDTLVSIKGKKHSWEILKDKFDLHAVHIKEEDIDGRLFKTTAHGLEASLKGLLDYAVDRVPLDTAVKDHNDFTLQVKRELKTPSGAFKIAFSDDYTYSFEYQADS
ncbi:MAG: DUF2920 family protein [Methylocystaceae bacterium]|nr:DUF2920 family protein [Methylocystaceae bacterium]